MKKIYSLLLRYIFALILVIGNFYIITRILSPLTIHTVNFIINIFTKTTLIADVIYTSSAKIQIVSACLASSAFFLLIFLILSTPNIKPKKRIKIVLVSILTLFIINVVRIIFLSAIISSKYFETIHWILWHAISIVIIVAIWLIVVRVYKIKAVPIYSDLKYLKSQIRSTNRPHS